MDIRIYGFVGITCSASLHCFWQGKVTLQGAEWQMGLLFNPFESRVSWEGGRLLLRPWSERNQSFSLYSGGLDVLPFSQKLFVGDHAYQLQCTSEVQGNIPKVRVQFTEQTPSLGELKIAGDAVQRVTLEGGAYLVVIDRPGATVKVPLGSYPRFRACLEQGDVRALLDGGSDAAAAHIAISEQKPAVLLAGGPLTNSVTLSRHGRNLLLNYQLVGAAGKYSLDSIARSHQPEFSIYQGDRKIASGKFEFG
jgi:hypothetical protein